MVSIGPTIQIKGEDQYRLSVRRIIQETKELGSEMDLLVAQFDKHESALSKNRKMHEQYGKQIESSKSQLSKLVEGLEKANQKHNDALQVYEKQKTQVASLENEQKRLVATMESLEKAGSKGSATWKGLNEQLEKNKLDLEDANKELVKADEEVSRSGRVLADWQTTVNKAEIELENLNKQFKDTSSVKAWGKELEEIGGKAVDFGNQLSMYLTAPLVALGGASIKAAADFEDGMAKIYTIAVDSFEPMGKMRDELIELSNATGFGLDDLAEATYQTVSASVDAEKAVEFMGQATKLARAGFTTTTKAVDVLTTIMNSYGKETYDTAYISDVLLKTQNDGKLIIDELASSLGIIIPMASNYNVGLEQIAASYATMTKQGVPASKATTFLRAVFTELEKESSDVAKILESKTGKSFAQLMGEGNNLSEVLRILYNEAGQNTEEFQRLFGNVRATQAVAALVTDDFSILDYELDRVSHSAGQTDKALEVMETPALHAKRAVNQLKNVTTDLGETMIKKFLPGFEKGVGIVKNLTDSFIGLSDESKNTIVNAGLLLASAGPLVSLAGKAAKYIGALILGTGSWVPIIAAVTAGVVGLVSAQKIANDEHIASIRNTYGLSDAMKEELARLDELKTSHEEHRVSMQEKSTATTNEISYVKELVAQYDNLDRENGEIASWNREQADFILNELANALGLEIDEVKKLIDENGKLSKSIQGVIDDYQRQAMMAILQEDLLEATRRKVEAERIEKDLTEQLAVASAKHTEALREREDAQRAVDDAIAKGNPVTEEMAHRLGDAMAAEKLANEAMWELRNGVNEAQKQYGEASKDIEYFNERMADAQKEAENAANGIEDSAKKSANAIAEEGNKAVKSLEGSVKEAYTHGMNVAKGYAKGIEDYMYLGSSAASSLGSSSAKQLKNTLHEKSPSKLTAEIGRYFVEGFANPIKEGIGEMGYLATRLGESAVSGLSLGSYMPETSNVVNNKTVTAPISINMTVNGNVDDPDGFARNIADQLTDLINRERSVFA